MIKQLDKAAYKGHELIFKYTTDSFYDVIYKENENIFAITLAKKSLKTPIEKTFTSTLFEPYLDNPLAFGYFLGDTIVGYIEVNKEIWHNALRVTNILVDQQYRRQKVGKTLMDYIKDYATAEKHRVVLLETQSCNTKAIDFYRKQGFKLVGLNMVDYTNNDINNKEVRLEFGYKL
ncbi:MAG: GNAT family N-acetyltransferase [Bacillota bacterium]